MPLEDISNRAPKFRLHVDLASEYATFRSLKPSGVNNVPLDTLRSQGRKCIDLWTNGFIYPIDPLTNAPPPFVNITSFLTYVGDGANGLFGYCRRLSFVAAQESHSRVHFQGLWHELQQQHKKDIDRLEEVVNNLKTQNQELQKNNLLLKQAFDMERDKMNAVKQDARNKKRCLASLKKLPVGFRQRKRKRQSLETLAALSGARKRRVQATRYFLFLLLICRPFYFVKHIDVVLYICSM